MTILSAFLLSALLSVSVLSFTPNTSIGKTPKPEHSFISKTFRCNIPNNYKLVRERDTEANYVNIVQDNKIKHSIKLPTGLTANGFAINWAKKTKTGFEISIEYGSRFYYEKEFNFVCKQHQFYLTRIKVNTFDKNDPENSEKNYNTKIKANIPLAKFKVTDYMKEFGN